MCTQVRIAMPVVLAFGMLPPVSLDDQSSRWARKVNDVIVDRQLALELMAGEALRAKDLP